jgi:hypothetical protein
MALPASVTCGPVSVSTAMAGPCSDETDEDRALLACDLTAVRFPGSPDKCCSHWYVGADIILRHDPGWVAVARPPEALDAFRKAHPGDWVNE